MSIEIGIAIILTIVTIVLVRQIKKGLTSNPNESLEQAIENGTGIYPELLQFAAWLRRRRGKHDNSAEDTGSPSETGHPTG